MMQTATSTLGLTMWHTLTADAHHDCDTFAGIVDTITGTQWSSQLSRLKGGVGRKDKSWSKPARSVQGVLRLCMFAFALLALAVNRETRCAPATQFVMTTTSVK
jgi:hypothetical protein